MKNMLLAGLLICAISSLTLSAADEKEARALEAATAWLALIDAEKYAESWESAATYFKEAVKKDKWQEVIGPVRKPLGNLVTRKIDTRTYKTEIAGAPDGEYYILQYNSSFDKKFTTVETIIMMLEKDGSWKCSGYFIK